jgi:hypothetical protein
MKCDEKIRNEWKFQVDTYFEEMKAKLVGRYIDLSDFGTCGDYICDGADEQNSLMGKIVSLYPQGLERTSPPPATCDDLILQTTALANRT